MRTCKNVFSDCHKVQEPTPDKNEFFEVIHININEFREYLRSGKLGDRDTGYLELDYLNLL